MIGTLDGHSLKFFGVSQISKGDDTRFYPEKNWGEGDILE